MYVMVWGNMHYSNVHKPDDIWGVLEWVRHTHAGMYSVIGPGYLSMQMFTLNCIEALIVHGSGMLCINVYLLFVAHVKDCCRITDTWVNPYNSILWLDAMLQIVEQLPIVLFPLI